MIGITFMGRIKSLTLCEIIDYIVQNSKEDIVDYNRLVVYNSHVAELSSRLSINKISAVIFSYVFWKSTRGEWPTKKEMVTDVANERTKDIYYAISELIKNNLIKFFRPHPRRPEMCFYTLEELDKLIVANKAPIQQNKNPVAKSVISLLPFENGKDNWIYLNDSKIGVVYHLTTDFGNYTAIVGDNTIIHSDTIDEIVNRLNFLLKENKLKI